MCDSDQRPPQPRRGVGNALVGGVGVGDDFASVATLRIEWLTASASDSPVAMPWWKAARGINDGPSESNSAELRSGAAGLLVKRLSPWRMASPGDCGRLSPGNQTYCISAGYTERACHPTSSTSPGRQLPSIQGSVGPYMRKHTKKLFPGMVWSQLLLARRRLGPEVDRVRTVLVRLEAPGVGVERRELLIGLELRSGLGVVQGDGPEVRNRDIRRQRHLVALGALQDPLL